MEEQSSTTCLNCSTEFISPRCPECGQSAQTCRLGFWNLLRDFTTDALSLDTGILRTAVGLTRSPGRVCAEYVAGRRVSYASPLRYALLILTV